MFLKCLRHEAADIYGQCIIIGGGTFLLTGCSVLADPTPDYRYRLTVEVDTPEGVKTGSSVIEVNTWASPGEVRHKLSGEAVTVNLGTRGLLFALLRHEQNPDWPKNILFLLAPDVPYVKGEDQFLKRFGLILKMHGQVLYVSEFKHLRVLSV